MQACLQVDPEMPLRNDDRDWIRGEITAAIAALKPRGWHKALSLLREWSVLGVTAMLIVALLALAAGAFYQATTRVKEEATFRTHTEDRLTGIEGNVASIKAALEGMKLEQIGSSPANPESITEAKNILKVATSNKTKIDPSIVKDVAIKFVEASQEAPAAWNAVMAFLEYRSFLNEGSLPPLPKHTGITRYGIEWPKGHAHPELSHYGDAPPSQAAILEKIGEGLNKSAPVGDAYLLLEGAELGLDNFHAKNVIFRNVHIIYHGEPVQLENVYFVNCTFEITRQPNGVEFAKKVLEPTALTNFAVG